MKNNIIKNLSAILIFTALLLQLFFPAIFASAEEPAASTTPADTEQTTASTTEASPSEPDAALPPAATSTDLVGPTASTTAETATTSAFSTTTPAIESYSTSTPASSTTLIAPTTSTSVLTPSTSSEQTGTPSIISGDAVAMANILNMVNTNFINSNGVILFSNFFDFIQNSLDLRDGALFDGSCTQGECSGSNASFNLGNDAFINNLLSIYATTGGNTIEGGATSTIETGDAYAGLNLINVANTNFVDSEYLLVTLNAFQGVNGDIVFPSLSNFFNSLKQSSGTIQLDNQANVQNDLNVGSDSGGNSIGGNGTISTGNATSTSNIFNQLNSNLVGGTNVSILFRVHGNWAGEVFGAPDNLKWTQSPNGIYLFDTASGSATGQAGQVDVTGTNNASINNNVSVVALTGKNAITGASNSLISTGNAVAGANIVNIANTNIIGRNWIMAIINIFGDFRGNIAFGRPDLWVGAQVSAPAEIRQGDTLQYKLTIMNNGDSPATLVKLSDDNLKNFEISEASVPYTKDEQGNMVWNIGTLPAGKAAEIIYRAKVLVDKEMDVSNTIKALARETDNNIADNTETASVHIKAKAVSRPGGHRRSGGSSAGKVLGASTIATSSKALSIHRSNPLSILKNRGDSVHQRLTIKNPSDFVIKSVIIRDILRSPTGKIIHTEAMNFGDINPHEEIIVTYDLEFGSSAANGFYNLSSTIQTGKTVDVSSGITGLILLGDFLPAKIAAAKTPKTTSTQPVAIANKEIARSEPAPVTIAIATSSQIVETKKNPSGFLASAFSFIPKMLGKVLQSVSWR